MNEPRLLNEEVIDRLRALRKIVLQTDHVEPMPPTSSKHFWYVQTAEADTLFLVRSVQSMFVSRSFSASISLIEDLEDRRGIMLARYNGPAHDHINHIEKTYVDKVAHIHTFTERYQQASWANALGYAQPTDRYRDLKGALEALAADWQISDFHIPTDLTGQVTW